MSKAPTAKAGIEKIKLYTPGAAPLGAGELIKLSSNENLSGPSPKAIAAVEEAAKNLWKYPSADHLDLREAIAGVHALPLEQIMCGAGSDEILSLLAQAYAGAGDEVIVTEYGFEIYGIVTHAVGADLVRVAERERVIDIDAILEAVNARTKLIYIANPANPTGTILPQIKLEELAKRLPRDVLLVIDSAYAEFAPDYDGGASLVRQYENVVMTRTFSKLYGLGGLRVGWCFAPLAIIDTLNRIRGPFNLSSAALAGAKAAVLDQDYAQSSLQNILASRDYLRQAALQFGIKVDESAANFLLLRFESEEMAQSVRNFLAENGYLVRSVAHYNLPNALRVSIAPQEMMIEIARLLGEFMGEKR